MAEAERRGGWDSRGGAAEAEQWRWRSCDAGRWEALSDCSQAVAAELRRQSCGNRVAETKSRSGRGRVAEPGP